MTFFSRRNASLALSLAAVGVLAACGDDVTVPVVITPVTVSITPQAVTLNPGASATLSVQIAGGDPTPTLASCTSGATGVATATVSGNSCTVTAVASGSTTITATTSTGQSASAAVSVNSLPAALGQLTVSPATAALSVGQAVTLVPNANPAGSGVTTTYTYTSSSSGIASVNASGVVTAASAGTATITVTATGTGTGFTSSTRTFGVTINVSNSPPALSGLTVSPMSLSIATGGTGQLAASVAGPAASGASVSYSSSNSSIATVAGAGSTATVVGVTPGTATITVTATSAGTSTLSATTLTQLVPVTVSQQANVSIQTVTQGPVMTTYSSTAGAEGLVTSNNPNAGQPVDITNTRDQIQVVVNLLTNGQRVDSVVVSVGSTSAARQTFTSGQASSGTLTFFVNTAEFTADFGAGTSTVLYPNGQQILSATVWTTDAAGTTTAIQNAVNNRQSLNFNNVDGWAARFVVPANVAQGTSPNQNLNWYGGPLANGTGTYTVVPVFYTPGRSVQTVTTWLRQMSTNLDNTAGSVAACGALTFPVGTTNRTANYGVLTASATNVNCAGYEHANIATPLDLPLITAAIDNQNNAAPLVNRQGGYRTSTTVTQPVAIRLDYNGPSFTVAKPLNSWASAAVASPYSFRTNTSGIADGGVGASPVSTFTYTFTGCSLSAVAMPNASALDMNECGTDFTADVFQVSATGTDVLGNTTVNTTPSTPNRFAIDNTAPAIRYTNGTAFTAGTATPGQGPGSFSDSATFTTLGTTLFTGTSIIAVPAATDTVFGADVLDERSGFDAAAASHFLAFANQGTPTGSCTTGGTGLVGTSFITAPTCSFVNGGLTLGAAMVDGYVPVQPRILGSDILTEGYYTYQIRVMDRAGNLSTLSRRRVLHNVSTPLMTGIGLPATLTAAGPNAFTPNFATVVEANFTNLRPSYLGLTAEDALTEAELIFPATLYNARFNDVIGLNGNLSTSTPFTSGVNYYTNIEQTTTAGAITAPIVNTPDSASARVVNVAGQPSTWFTVPFLGANVGTDAVTWATKSPFLISWTLGTDASAWNAPANGLKAVVTATTNQINSPFARVDFYEQINGNWQYIGQVNAQATPCTSPAQNCEVYIADNGASRVWTYRLTSTVNGTDSLLGSTTLGALSGGARRFIAVASNGTAGRVLSTNVATASSTVLP